MADTRKSRRASLQHIRLAGLPGTANPSSGKPPRSPLILHLQSRQATHAGLWLDKYITSLERGDTASHAQLVDEVAQLSVPTIYRAFYTRWEHLLRDEYDARLNLFEVKGRMVVGLGSEGVLETSIMLHRTYGVPYIPGSALKGLAASYARLMAGPDWTPPRDGETNAYKLVFGDTKEAGYVTFFDALYEPDSASKDQPLRADVITVHHPEYYKGNGTAPADWDSPNPVSFLSATGRYLVALAAPDLPDRAAWLASVFELLQEALLTLGIGAKTSSGYGRMKRLNSGDRS